jgi:MFS family permease
MRLGFPQARRAFPLNLFVTFLGFLDTHMLIPIIALHAEDLGAGVGVAGLIVGLYSLANTPANIFFGRVVDRAGYKRPLVIGLLGDAVGMLSYALCRAPFHLALVRLFHGTTGGLVGPATMSVTAGEVSRTREGRGMGLYGLALGMATLVGYGMSGMLADRLGYNFIFYAGSVALVVGVFLALAMPGVRRGAEADAAEPRGAVGQDWRQILGLLRRRGLTTSYSCIFAQYFAFGGVVTLLPLYVEDLGMETFHVGMLLATFAAVYALLQFPSGALSDRVSRALPIAAGLCVSMAALAVIPGLETFGVLAIAMAAYGAAYALLFPSISALIADRVVPGELGRATGVFHALLTAGVALGAPVMGWVGEWLGVETGLALAAVVPAIALVVARLDLRRGA